MIDAYSIIHRLYSLSGVLLDIGTVISLIFIVLLESIEFMQVLKFSFDYYFVYFLFLVLN